MFKRKDEITPILARLNLLEKRVAQLECRHDGERVFAIEDPCLGLWGHFADNTTIFKTYVSTCSRCGKRTVYENEEAYDRAYAWYLYLKSFEADRELRNKYHEPRATASEVAPQRRPKRSKNKGKK